MTSSPAPTTPATAAPAVEARAVRVAYGSTVAVNDATLSLPRGAVTAIIGPNGSGKTTLLRAISGLQRPDAGSVAVLGRPAGQGRTDVAHVMQSTKVNDAVPLTVREVVRMGRYGLRGPLGRFRAEDAAAVDEAMARMEVVDLAARHLRELSGGQRQRVYVAQGLAQQADVLLLDEPITGLDLVSQDRIEQVVAEERAAGRTVVLTTHDVDTAGAADHVVLMATHVVASGPPAEVLTAEHLSHAYGGRVFTTAEGTVVIADPHHHGVGLTGHEHH
ncbi:MAG: metal ABC transporter ATP-binding protein [Actinomycetes bacterium]